MISKFKNCLSFILCFSFYTANAQKAAINNIDSIYYFIDTAKTPINDRMWDIGIESSYQYFSIKCQCLKYGAEPIFVYKTKDPGQTIDKKAFRNLETVSLLKLINLAKQTADLTATTLYIYFFIEKKNKKDYTIHKVRLIIPQKPRNQQLIMKLFLWIPQKLNIN